ncbi:MRN complex-interacting protein [Pectinophora gossypiella]|uniref:MRN complex-interacting protein n=1 Tax=Pectinophora gossypiella TaxID=13191 RepID=UPI00214E51ED|nr:MRN complex-interacting protein [Pectinophora gossypiella]
MPQTFQVLRCYKCLVFQVHQTKKSNKWECKMCAAKQSVKRHYGIGTAKDCRLHVQKLNGIRGEMDELKETKRLDSDDEEEFIEDNTHIEECDVKTSKSQTNSKWSKYIDDSEEVTESVPEATMYLNNTEVVFEMPKKRKRTNFKTPVLRTPLWNSNSKKQTDDSQSNVNSNTSNPVYDNDGDDLASITMMHSETKYLATTEPEVKKYLPSNYFIEHELVKENTQLPVNDQKTVPPMLALQKVSSTSKWAQYVDEEFEDNDESDMSLSLNKDNFQSQKKNQELFTLCDDGDLDNVLDI